MLADRTIDADLTDGFRVRAADGVELAVYAWCQAPDRAPALLFAHANGFNAGCYLPFLQRLAGRFQVFAVDQRGHGASTILDPDQPGAYAMECFAADLGAVAAAISARLGDGGPLHFAAHSLGAVAGLLLAGGAGPAPWASMTLFEPPIYPPVGHPLANEARPTASLFVEWGRRRRQHFRSLDEFRAEMAKNDAFARFAPEMMDAFVAAAQKPAPDGPGLVLSCPGPVESRIYAECPAADIFGALPAVPVRAMVYGSDPALARGSPWTAHFMEEVAAALPRGRYRLMPRATHLMVQERPDAAAEAVTEMALAGAD